MQGEIDRSIEDFDSQIKLQPNQEPWHWKRGISYYYAGRYDEGRRQFEGYQSVDDNDVENAVWRFLCMARASGVANARAALLKIKNDPRVPMSEVYRLFAGQAEPDDVLAAAAAGSPSPAQLNERLFYAHLYLGLHYEAAGDAQRAREHIDRAGETTRLATTCGTWPTSTAGGWRPRLPGSRVARTSPPISLSYPRGTSP